MLVILRFARGGVLDFQVHTLPYLITCASLRHHIHYLIALLNLCVPLSTQLSPYYGLSCEYTHYTSLHHYLHVPLAI
jgi:hypothetical protein